jgi:hypothetical protein
MRRLCTIFAIAFSTLLFISICSVVTQAQSVLVSNDEWMFADGYLNYPGTDDSQFANNVAQWLTGGPGSGQVLLLVSSSIGLGYNSLATQLNSNGYNVVGPTTTVPSLTTLLTYKAIYLSGPNLIFNSSIPNYAALDAALVTYVQQSSNPGNVFIMAGTRCNDYELWNGFLNTFGMSLAHTCNLIGDPTGVIVPVAPFGTQPPYGMALFGSAPPVNNIFISNGENVSYTGTIGGVQIFNYSHANAVNGLYGAWRPGTCNSGPNLVINGSFETGDFTGYTVSGDTDYTGVASGAFYTYTGAEDGGYYAVLGPVGAEGVLNQNIATTSGTSYTFCFWLNAVGDNISNFTASWDGNPVYSQSDPNTGNAWTLFSFPVTGTGFDNITFIFRDDPGWIALDNVSVK